MSACWVNVSTNGIPFRRLRRGHPGTGSGSFHALQAAPQYGQGGYRHDSAQIVEDEGIGNDPELITTNPHDIVGIAVCRNAGGRRS